MFLTSQLEYLRGLDCCGAPSGAASGARANDTTREHMDRACETPIELHILCQERYDDDWRRLLETFGLRSQQMSRTATCATCRRAVTCIAPAEGRRARVRSRQSSRVSPSSRRAIWISFGASCSLGTPRCTLGHVGVRQRIASGSRMLRRERDVSLGVVGAARDGRSLTCQTRKHVSCTPTSNLSRCTCRQARVSGHALDGGCSWRARRASRRRARVVAAAVGGPPLARRRVLAARQLRAAGLCECAARAQPPRRSGWPLRHGGWRLRRVAHRKHAARALLQKCGRPQRRPDDRPAHHQRIGMCAARRHQNTLGVVHAVCEPFSFACLWQIERGT
jgi:hypothetical protein